MRGIDAMLLASLFFACGGRANHDVSDPMPLGPGSGAVGTAGSVGVEAAGAGSEAPPSLERGTCVSDPSGTLSGNIAGVPTSLGLVGTSVSSGHPIAQNGWTDLRASSPDEALLAWGSTGPDGGPQQSGGALVVVPKPQVVSTFYCAASVAVSEGPGSNGPAASIALTALSVLGECPGAPVSGKVDVCLGGGDAGDGCTESFEVTGEVDGNEVRWRYLGGTISAGYLGDDFQASVIGENNDDGVILFANAADGQLRGWLRLSNNNPSEAGSVYCLSDAHVARHPNGDHLLSFQSIGRLGPCPGTPVDGELGYCGFD